MSDRSTLGVFDYTSPSPEAIRAGVAVALARCDEVLAAVVAVPEGARTFANTLRAIEEAAAILGDASGQWGFLTYVHTDPAIREAAQAAEQALDTYATALGFREDLYRAVQAFAATPEAARLEPVEARLLEHTLRDYRRNGFDLPPEQRARVQVLKERLVVLAVDFRRNIDEYEDALLLERAQLAGLPDSYIERLQVVETPEGPRFRVSLDYPELYPFLESADDEGLRRELFLKNHLKAAAVNLPLLAEAIAVRDEIASILGYVSWAAYVTETKMAKTPEAASAFLADLRALVQVKAERDIAELTASKRTHTGDPAARLEIWDWRYYQQRVRRERFEVDQFAVAEYFPLQATLGGLFDIYQRAFGVRFVEVPDAAAWHPDVRLYRIEDAADGRHIGCFYTDLHPRPGKYGHAAEFTLRPGRMRPDGTYQGSICSIVSNFTKPSADAPSLLRHSEVETLFHEFGHVLHQSMTRAPYVRFNGTNVERDFVEAPSQMLEHWVWDVDVLRGFTRHVRTGEPLPEALLQRMMDAKNVASGLHYLRQIYFATLDLAYHGPGREKDTDALARDLHEITGFPFPEGTHFQAGFGHLFGYDAGYYGYLWSQVFGDDMFTRFEAGDPAAGADYRRLVLEGGGTLDGSEIVRTFLGREPRQEAFLREIGLDPAV
ncbi:MAG: dipeptidyl carboxypeptidase II [Chloroflexota bacterium]